MPERRSHERPDSPDRRTFPRPPLWLTLALILLGVAGLVFARYHREATSRRFARVIEQDARTPEDLRKVKQELAEMDLNSEALRRELQGRSELIAGLKSENFQIAIDTRAKKLRFFYGDTLLREADVVVGEPRSIRTATKSWTFAPLRGAFRVEAKLVGSTWRVPEWVYAMNGQPVPSTPQAIENGMGRYVIVLPNGYAIHSPPPDGSPLKGPKPGSFMVPEADLTAIWPRIHKGQTQVYVF